MTKNSKILNTLLATSALALSLGLFACGGQQAQPQQAEPVQQQEQQQAEPAQQQEQQAPEAKPAEPAPAPQTTAPTQTADSYIGNDEAKRIALSHAGVNEGDCYDLDVELDLDDGTVHYDVDFKAGGMEYDYDINAVTGEVIFYNSEYDD